MSDLKAQILSLVCIKKVVFLNLKMVHLDFLWVFLHVLDCLKAVCHLWIFQCNKPWSWFTKLCPQCKSGCLYVHALRVCVCRGVDVFESPLSGVLPPQGRHFWSIECELQAWPRGLRRSSWMQYQPSAAAPAFPPPPDPQGGLQDRHTNPYSWL